MYNYRRNSPTSSRKDSTLPSLWRRFQSRWSSPECSEVALGFWGSSRRSTRLERGACRPPLDWRDASTGCFRLKTCRSPQIRRSIKVGDNWLRSWFFDFHLTVIVRIGSEPPAYILPCEEFVRHYLRRAERSYRHGVPFTRPLLGEAPIAYYWFLIKAFLTQYLNFRTICSIDLHMDI